jgi:hypothetical protein
MVKDIAPRKVGDMDDKVGKELTAVGEVVKALQALDPDSRARVVEYVFKLLGIKWLGPERAVLPRDETVHRQSGDYMSGPVRTEFPVTDIYQLKEQKKPRSANQMAALVAYYLKEIVPVNQRKESIGAEDIDLYFKQARFHLPKRAGVTLTNAKNAGYFDSAGVGQYRLNAVGYNLVAYSLPSQGAKERPGRETRRKKRLSEAHKNVKA